MEKLTTSKTITLPSGSTVKVRRITVRDWLKISAEVPDVLAPAPTGKPAPKDKKRSMEDGLALNRLILLECTGKIKSADGKLFTVCDKSFKDADSDNGELSIDEVSDSEDGAAIVKEVLEISGLTKAASEAAKPFPEEPETPAQPPCDVLQLRSASV